MLSVAIGANGRIFVPGKKRRAVNTPFVFRRDRSMTFRTGIRNIQPVHSRSRVSPLLHFVASMTVDAIRSFAVSTLQGNAMYALFIRQDKTRGGRIGRRLLVLDMTCDADLFLGNFELRRIRSRFDSSNVFGMAGNACWSVEVSGKERFAMSRREVFFFLSCVTLTTTLHHV